MVSSPDARLSVGLFAASLLSLGAFLWTGFGELPTRTRIGGESLLKQDRADPGTQFVPATDRMGLGHFVHDTLGIGSILNTVAPGLGLLDLDGDSDLDLVLLGGPGQDPSISIYLGDGRGHFEDATAAAGVVWRGLPQGVCAGDFDGDYDVDLFITAIGANLLLRNELRQTGRLAFTDATAAAGLTGGRYYWTPPRSGGSGEEADEGERPAIIVHKGPAPPGSLAVPEFSTGASFGDVDGDGLLDLFVANYVGFHPEMVPDDAPPTAAYEANFPPLPDRLYRNVGNGRFEDVSDALGLSEMRGSSLGAVFFQADDRAPELYVAEDLDDGNKVLRNRIAAGRGMERQEIGYNLKDYGASNGLAFGDADNDGDIDLVVTNGPGDPLSLFFSHRVADEELKDGLAPPVRFVEDGLSAGLSSEHAELHGRGVVWFDYDNDGLLDLAVAHGGGIPLAGQIVGNPEPLLLYHNLGGGRFEEVGAAAGLQLESYHGRGLVAGDLDFDGDLDLVLAQNNGPVVIFENQLQAPDTHHYSMVMSTASGPGPLGLDPTGNRLLLECEPGVQQQQLISGGSYLSQGPRRIHFGLGRRRTVEIELVSRYWQWIRDRTFSGIDSSEPR